ncbi:MAG: hypothetical protein K2X35_17365 [Bryobacteraceae bacterium]|nr:hypothetical protein [Bryobacteraceae bacterium]
MNGSLILPADLETVPDAPAVFMIWLGEGSPYLARTALLRRRLKRLLAESGGAGRSLNLTSLATRVDYRLVGSNLESSLVLYELARQHFPGDYERRIKLRHPAYVKLTENNPFPRTLVTTKLSGRSMFYGPFRSRAAAERFQGEFLNLFQLRRCQEDLKPSPDHPGCIYGEMNLCLRPCQQVVSEGEYANEATRVRQFLASGGASLLTPLAAARQRASDEMDFEEAARLHQRYERVEGVIALREDLAREVSSLHGVAVTRSAAPGAVELLFLKAGGWLRPVRLQLQTAGVSLDQRLRQETAHCEHLEGDRAEHLALLARWYYSSWRDGEFLLMEDWNKMPYRRIVNAIARVMG